MDFKSLISVILGLTCLNTVSAYLRCIECTHISWDQSTPFEGSQQIYEILRQRYNPACAMEYPLDRRAYEQQQAVSQQQSPVFLPNNYQVSETICAAISDSNRCNYVHGEVDVYLTNYQTTLRLDMHVRNCMSTPSLEDTCYARDTNLGYQDIRNFLQDRLSFLSKDLRVTRFIGNQCVCKQDLCSAKVSSAVRIQGFTLSLILLFASYLFSKLH